ELPPAPEPVVVAPAPPAPEPPAVERSRAPLLLGSLTSLIGLLLLFANVFHDREAYAVARVAGHVATVVAGAGLLIVAGQLRRGKRRAWAAAGVLFGVAGGGAVLRR